MGKIKKINITLSQEELAKINDFARSDSSSRSGFIRRAVRIKHILGLHPFVMEEPMYSSFLISHRMVSPIYLFPRTSPYSGQKKST